MANKPPLRESIPQEARIEQLRVPPMSIEAEQAVLGGLMLAPDALDIVVDIVHESDFYRRDHQLIFKAISELADKNRPYDAVTLGEWFEAQGLAELVAGGAYLIQLASTTPSAANISAYAEIVRDKATLRQLIEVGTGIVNDGFQPDGRETTEILANAENAVLRIGGTGVIKGVQTGKEGLVRTYVEMDRRRKLGDQLLGVSTSLDDLDEATNGLQDDDLIILAARPSMGKTALMGQLRRQAAITGRKPLTFSMEMSAPQIYMRDVAALARVDYAKVQRPDRMSEEETHRVGAAFAKMKDWEWWLDDSPPASVVQLAARIRRMKKQHDIGIVFIDYLQLIDISELLRAGYNTNAAIQEVTRTLKALAKLLHLPIVLLSQLNRGVEGRGDKRPNLSDLRESGAIEQDADLILFLHRQGYYEKDWARDDPRHNVAEVIVGKSRTGTVGPVSVQWQGQFQRFNNLSYENIPSNYRDQRTRSRNGFSKSGRSSFGPDD